MNLFEDLVEELKDENLLEATVIETSESENQAEFKNIEQPQINQVSTVIEISAAANDLTPSSDLIEPKTEINDELRSVNINQNDLSLSDDDFAKSFDDFANYQNVEDLAFLLKEPNTESEFYRRRATEEVSALKIVEHILSGVEREHMKISPKTYDDVPVSIALHDFLKITLEVQSPEHAQSEFKLMQETESWYSSLSYRDKHISVGDLRRYCETSKPPLSSQALVSLARFYRNSPFSESVRSKFDMVITRLFSKETENDKRLILFEKSELIEQLSGLYADWSSIPLYASDDDPEVLIAALKFGDFVTEVTNTNSFEELIKNDFFNRLRIFKENTGENFFAPLLSTTAIESNIEIGNKYVQLVSQAREKHSVSHLEEKYKYLVDQVVSDTTSKTLQLVELLKTKVVAEPQITRLVEEKEFLELPQKSEAVVTQENRFSGVLFGINKWIIVLAVVAVLFCISLYTYVEVLTPQIKPSPDGKTYNLANSPLKEFYKTAKINKDTLFAITMPEWESLSKETKEDILKKTLSEGSQKGYLKVHLINGEGKTVGFASEKGIELTKQQ
jgi:hypothetical protein